MKLIVGVVVSSLALTVTATAAAEQPDRFAPVFESGGIQVYSKADFDEGDTTPSLPKGKAKWRFQIAVPSVAAACTCGAAARAVISAATRRRSLSATRLD